MDCDYVGVLDGEFDELLVCGGCSFVKSEVVPTDIDSASNATSVRLSKPNGYGSRGKQVRHQLAEAAQEIRQHFRALRGIVEFFHD